jgi:transposase
MDLDEAKENINNMWPHLNERSKRLLAASTAKMLGYGGITAVSDICGLSRVTITKGLKELGQEPLEGNRIRTTGSGRPTLVSSDPDLIPDLQSIVEASTRGDPESYVLWTFLSTRKIAEILVSKGHSISYHKLGDILNELGYSLQSNRKVIDGKEQEDRNEQFLFINSQVKKAIKAGQPVISVDTKKKELVGNFKNPGAPWRIGNDPIKVNVHDFPDPLTPKAIPYGIYDIGFDTGFINVGSCH